MRIKGVIVLLLVCLLASVAAFAQYNFQVPLNHSVVTVRPDASVEIRYTITFRNSGQPIDIIDVGLPDKNYSLGDITADLDGAPLTDIRHSEYVAHGVEVHLLDKTIPAGSEGTLHLTAVATDRVYRDDDDKEYASLVFTTTWYDSQFTSGTTDLVCEFVLPEGVGPDEPRYHEDPFTSARVENERVVYRWEIPDASPSRGYTFGASFPARTMGRVVEGPGPVSRFFSALFGFLGALVSASLPCLFFGGFIGIFVLIIVQNVRRRKKYLPPSVGMEGVEVRRGLTVPEVAVLMEKPVDRVMALLLFGMVRKGQLKVVSRKPLKLELIKGKEPGTSYEQEFAKAVSDDGKVDEKEAIRVMTDIIKAVKTKMKGFSRKKSLAYYKDIMRKAWDQVGDEDYSQAFEWLLLDKDFEKTATQKYGNRPMPIPTWWPSMYTGRPYSGGGGAASSGASIPSPIGSAHGIVSGLEGFASDLVNSVPGLATKVTSKTNPVPVSRGGGGGRSGGGGGCACACACAGCACACAGGGR